MDKDIERGLWIWQRVREQSSYLAKAGGSSSKTDSADYCLAFPEGMAEFCTFWQRPHAIAAVHHQPLCFQELHTAARNFEELPGREIQSSEARVLCREACARTSPVGLGTLSPGLLGLLLFSQALKSAGSLRDPQFHLELRLVGEEGAPLHQAKRLFLF